MDPPFPKSASFRFLARLPIEDSSVSLLRGVVRAKWEVAHSLRNSSLCCGAPPRPPPPVGPRGARSSASTMSLWVEGFVSTETVNEASRACRSFPAADCAAPCPYHDHRPYHEGSVILICKGARLSLQIPAVSGIAPGGGKRVLIFYRRRGSLDRDRERDLSLAIVSGSSKRVVAMSTSCGGYMLYSNLLIAIYVIYFLVDGSLRVIGL